MDSMKFVFNSGEYHKIRILYRPMPISTKAKSESNSQIDTCHCRCRPTRSIDLLTLRPVFSSSLQYYHSCLFLAELQSRWHSLATFALAIKFALQLLPPAVRKMHVERCTGCQARGALSLPMPSLVSDPVYQVDQLNGFI